MSRKIAKLPGGRSVSFPADMPDDEMDGVVKRLLGVDGAEKQAAEEKRVAEEQARYQAEEERRIAEEEKRAAAEKARKEEEDRRFSEMNSRREKELEAHINALSDVGDKVQASIGDLKGALDAVQPLMSQIAQIGVQQSKHVVELVKAVNALSATIVKVGDSVVRAMEAPRVVQHNEDGVPIGMRIKTEKKH